MTREIQAPGDAATARLHQNLQCHPPGAGGTMAAMDTNKRPPDLLAASVHDGAKEYRARTVSTIATLPREAGGNVPAFRGLVDVLDHDEKSSATLWMGPPTSSQHDAFEAATLWLSHWLLDAGVVTS